MEIAFQIPRILQPYAEGTLELRLCGQTVGGVLEELQRDYPLLYRCICNETGTVRQHINLFVNNSVLKDRTDLSAPLTSGDIVSVFQAVSGG